jgi:hypothetical protein
MLTTQKVPSGVLAAHSPILLLVGRLQNSFEKQSLSYRQLRRLQNPKSVAQDSFSPQSLFDLHEPDSTCKY